ncbi:MAG: SAM-dependent methyltransferase, partial [Burkholderiales bacterium]
QEEIDHLRAAGIAVEVVPGVTAALAAGAELGASLTQRGLARSVAFVTPRVGVGEGASNWAQSAAAADTAVIYMAAGEARATREALIAAGVSPGIPVAVVENASLDSSRIAGTLAQLELLLEGRGDGPVVILLGRAMRKAAAPALSVPAQKTA